MKMLTTNLPALKRRGRLVISGLLLSLLLGALAFVSGGWHNRSKGASDVHPAGVAGKDTADAQVILASPGRVEGRSEVVEVGAGVDGVLTAVLVREGQKVTAGQTVALVSCADLQRDLEASRALVESGRQARVRLVRGSREEERQRASADTASAEAVLNQAELRFERMSRLFESGDMARETVDKARRDLDVARASLEATRQRERLANAPPLPEELARADAEVKSAEERMNAAAARLGKCAVKAPISGTVLRTHLKAGETVSSVFPRPVISMADTAHLRVRAEVDERDIGRVGEGQKVKVLVDAYPGREFSGHVSSVGGLMGRKKVSTGDPAEKSDRDVLEVLIDLAKPDTRLVVGLRVTAQFLVDHKGE
jgi:HlyD family secretion protein